MISSFTDTKQYNYNSLMAGIKFDTYTAVKKRKMKEKTNFRFWDIYIIKPYLKLFY